MIKVLFWNCRGIGNIPTKTMLHQLLGSHTPDLIFLAESKIFLDSSISFGFQSLGFNTSFFNSNNSLWCFCKFSIEFADLLTSSSDLISGFYGSIDYRTRKILWHYLESISSTALPWCVIGDFNSILLAYENMKSYMVLYFGLKDLGFRDNCFT